MKPFPQFSPVLFWDTNGFDPERDADTLIERVVEPGTLRDFKEILAFYGRETVKDALLKSTGLSARDLHFCSIYFRCR